MFILDEDITISPSQSPPTKRSRKRSKGVAKTAAHDFDGKNLIIIQKCFRNLFSFSCVIKPITDFELPPRLSLYLKFPGGKLEKGG